MFQKVLRWLAGRLGGTPAVEQFDQNGAAALAAAAKAAANTALQQLVDRAKPAAKTAIGAEFDKAAAEIDAAATPVTITALEDKLHQAAGSNAFAQTVVTAIEGAITVALATGAAQEGITQAGALTKAQLYRLEGVVFAAIDKAQPRL